MNFMHSADRTCIACKQEQFDRGGMDLIEVKQLVKKYGDHLAVDHLDFQMEAGKIYGFWDQTARENRRQ